MTSPGAQPFQVDLRGVVELLSRHIYSSPQVYLRELLQNGQDAIKARADYDPQAPAGQITVRPPALPGDSFIVTDNGVGLDAAEASDLLATVGRSSKRDSLLGLRRTGYLGQFGIGLLSCFMVTDRIEVRSRSARTGGAVNWIGTSDGTFTVREISGADAAALPIGTQVSFEARADESALVRPQAVRTLLARYGQYLPSAIDLAVGGGLTRLNRTPAFLQPVSDGDGALAALGDELLGATPLDIVELNVPMTGTRGVAFVLPYAPPPGSRQHHMVYLGRMLLSDQLSELMPDWAFFVRCVLNTEGLTPTASRERLVEDEAFEATREELGRQLRHWILRQASANTPRFHDFLAVHQLALKAMSLSGDDLGRTIVPHLVLETSLGDMTVADLIERYPEVRYTRTVDEFRQVAAVVGRDAPIVNAGYTYEAELLAALPGWFQQVSVDRVGVSDIIAELATPPLSERDAAVALEVRAEAVLADRDCLPVVRTFDPADLPALFVADPEVLRQFDRRRAMGAAPPLWAGLLSTADAILADERVAVGEPEPTARLCLNWSNRLVQRLVRLKDEAVFARCVGLIYVHALLAGHHPLRPADRALLTTAMTDLIELSVGWED